MTGRNVVHVGCCEASTISGSKKAVLPAAGVVLLGQLQLPEVPKEFEYILQWFYELRRFGKITFAEMQAWCALNDLQLEPFELETIIALETKYNELDNG